MHVIERAQFGQLQKQLGEDGGFVRVVLHDQVPQSSDQSLLQGLHATYILDGRSVCKGTRKKMFRLDECCVLKTNVCVLKNKLEIIN